MWDLSKLFTRVFMFSWFSEGKCSWDFCLVSGSCRGIKLTFQEKKGLPGQMKEAMSSPGKDEPIPLCPNFMQDSRWGHKDKELLEGGYRA